ncbi:hypothetical protein [Nannocystis punicea]|uniref:Uncharacterized protein n=1 Tax=Nannocystis punicea TaxID=2995304 RepID=A0ABY7H313_9BACT|nr:hypothetical protein [Nannocystis poenicansa]WAS93653.1 hypothetical protein O0S08_46570 [Nannocystis poenicansa]
MNTPRFTREPARNPAHGDWDPHLPLPPGLVALELGLVVGPVLEDIDYITDYSGPSGDDPQLRRYRALVDVLPADALVTWRARLVALLAALLEPGESWYLFVAGPLPPDFSEANEIFVGRVLAGDFELNGAFAILEVTADDLAAHAVLFGAWDHVAGLVAAEGQLPAVLARLSLAEALPTGQRYRPGSPFRVRDTSALERILGLGRLFFEETDNGTRLRLVTTADAAPELRSRLERITDDLR